MKLVAEQGFTPEGLRGPTVFQVWERDDNTFLMREVPTDLMGMEEVYPTMQEAVRAMKSLMVDRGFEPKGPKRKDSGLNTGLAQRVAGPLSPPSRFDRDDVV